MLCIIAGLLLPVLCPREHLGIQLPQGPEGRVWKISNTVCHDWDLGTDVIPPADHRD